MDVQLQELLEKIKDKGIKQAEKEAERIKLAAEEKAKEIIAQAKNKAEQLIEEAKKEIASFKQSTDQALKQAARDLILSLKTQIQTLFDTVIRTEAHSLLKSKVLEDILLTVIKAWIEKGITNITLMVAPPDLERLEKFLLSKCASEMKKGMVIKPLPEIEAGFRIMETNGTAYYNITDQGIAEFFKEYLNPKLKFLLEEKVKKGSEE
jgi:V/A-type H+-transporting ATPase subunit E